MCMCLKGKIKYVPFNKWHNWPTDQHIFVAVIHRELISHCDYDDNVRTGNLIQFYSFFLLVFSMHTKLCNVTKTHFFFLLQGTVPLTHLINVVQYLKSSANSAVTTSVQSLQRDPSPEHDPLLNEVWWQSR